jgi:hypothetical protein
MTVEEFIEKNFVKSDSTEFARHCWEAATLAERERCARVAEGVERPTERHWIPKSLYDTLRRETAAEIRRTP